VSASAAALRAASRAEGLAEPAEDPLALGEAAAVVALRRHLRAEAAYGPGGATARGVGLVVLSGGVFRHAEPAALEAVVDRLGADRGGAGGVLAGSRVVVDRRYVLAAAGLLAADAPAGAAGLLRGLLAEGAPAGSAHGDAELGGERGCPAGHLPAADRAATQTGDPDQAGDRGAAEVHVPAPGALEQQ
jgi:MutL protein